jgi:hypothetical protein
MNLPRPVLCCPVQLHFQGVIVKGVEMTNYKEASEFLRVLYPSESTITFQTFPNTERCSVKPKILHGNLERHLDYLQRANSQGAGVYGMVNVGDDEWRSNEHVTTIAGSFLDLDGSPLDPVLKSPIKPHAIIQTSPERFQVRWKVNPVQVNDRNRTASCELFRKIQRGVAEKFNGDRFVSGLSGVARVPGFWNMKSQPFLVRTIQLNDIPAYELTTLADAFDIKLKEKRRAFRNIVAPEINISGPILQGTRNQSLFDILRAIAYRGTLGEELLDMGLYINDEFCLPPLSEDHVRGIVCRIHDFCLRNIKPVSQSEHVDRILKTQHLCFSSGYFFKFDTRAEDFRILDKRTLVNNIFKVSGKRASRADINAILNRVEGEIFHRLPISPEAKFIRHSICEGGKATLSEIYGAYQDWCGTNNVRPLTNTCLRAEIEIRLNIRYGRIWLAGKTQKGFYGISLNSHCTRARMPRTEKELQEYLLAQSR